MKHATKFMVVPYANNTNQHVDPIQSYLITLDQEMNDILARNDITAKEKLSLYNQALNKYLNYSNDDMTTNKIQGRSFKKLASELKDEIKPEIKNQIKNEINDILPEIKKEMKPEPFFKTEIKSEINEKSSKDLDENKNLDKKKIVMVNHGKIKKKAKKLPIKIIEYSEDESVKTRKKKASQSNPNFYDLSKTSEKEIKNYYKNNPFNNQNFILDTSMAGDGLKSKWISKKFF